MQKDTGKAAILVALCFGLSACGNSDLLSERSKSSKNSESRVVVAIADSAFNPYHSFFYAGSLIYPDSAPSSVTPSVLAEFGIPPENQIDLTRSGVIATDIAADAEFWNRVKRGQPYWFKGTNLIAISTCDVSPLVPTNLKDSHGVGVSAAAQKANPEAILLLIEECRVDGVGRISGVDLAITHPATDIFSYSYTVAAPAPISEHDSYRGVVELGRLMFQSAGNEPGLTPIQPGPGFWWVIGVSGYEELGGGGQTLLAANFPDFVSDFTDTALPDCLDCETELDTKSGTSYSAPRAAGVASRVLLEARRTLGHGGGVITADDGRPALIATGGRVITNWDLRRALEEAAYVDYGIEDYSFEGEAIPGAPINPAAPWLQLGWGDLTALPEKQVIQEALAHLGLATPARFKDQGFCDFQAANMRFRQQYWDVAAATAALRGQSESVPDPNPYRYCESALLNSP